ncbi:hypothetical protein CLRAG_07420 [Clostridium ragsdalei P11]|uniref:YtxH-like protein n=1 Tax=Clostridium ragsdalei P11 TaxID=1353534 RepID=A0A1A6B0T9_9CLOT|nr:YtxH domain-containing protein [Clostridium ragsdalei]OBR95961.1 hypothetical protein CLRAG_07420 [Clostridium ragsdalei P11]
MRGKFVAGAVIGAAVGMMVVPELDRSKKRMIRKTSKYLRNTAGNMYGGVMNWMR